MKEDTYMSELNYIIDLMTEIDVVNYILDQSIELKTTYYKYQELLQSIRKKIRKILYTNS